VTSLGRAGGRPAPVAVPDDAPRSPAGARPRSLLRSVAVPAEHGGWGLTLEPALLGLLVAPSIAGGLLALAALTAFLARSPAKVALGDRWRHRRLPRTVVAERVALAEAALLVALLAAAAVTATHVFWVPLAIAAPLVALELWFDLRARGRRLVPELAGAVGVCSVATAIALADGRAAGLAAGLWMVLGARVVATIPFVREQIARLHGRPASPRTTDAASVVALLSAAGAVVVDARLLAGAVTVAAVVALQVVLRRRDPPRAVVIGIQQTVLGLVVVVITAAGVLTL